MDLSCVFLPWNLCTTVSAIAAAIATSNRMSGSGTAATRLTDAKAGCRIKRTTVCRVAPPITTNDDENIVKLPTIYFGYHYGRGLKTMHTNVMLMLSA